MPEIACFLISKNAEEKNNSKKEEKKKTFVTSKSYFLEFYE